MKASYQISVVSCQIDDDDFYALLQTLSASLTRGNYW